MDRHTTITRRLFLKSSLALGGGVAFSLHAPFSLADASKEDRNHILHSLIEVDTSGNIRIGLTKHEMGQGVETSLPRIIADEMEADWDDVTVVTLDYSKEVETRSLEKSAFSTGGSGSIQYSWTPYREMGAAIRELFCLAAAQQWGIPKEQCVASRSAIFRRDTRAKLSYFSLVNAVSEIPIPEVPVLKKTSEFNLIGKSCKSVSAPLKVIGRCGYSIDEKIPGMLYASIERAPVKGGIVKSYNKDAALALKGVLAVTRVAASPSYDMWMTGAKNGVAVIATTNWGAMQGRKALQVEWEYGINATRSSADIYTEFLTPSNVKTRVRKQKGSFTENLKNAAQIFRTEYRTPYLAHGLMEPLHAIARINDDQTVEVWAATQDAEYAAAHIAKELNIEKSKVTIYAKPSGGGFGRRYMFDYVIEAVLLAQKTGQTISLLWTREDEIQHGRYHPQRLDKYEIGLSETGEITAFGFDGFTTHPWGANTIVPRQVKNHQISSHVLKKLLVDYGSWRSVGRHLDCFSAECMVDEVAHLLGRDPLEYRLAIQGNSLDLVENLLPQKNDSLNTLLGKTMLVAAQIADWGRKRKSGVGLGIGAIKYKKTLCVQIAEVEANEERFKVKKIVCVIDCGLAVNPNHIKAQVEGSIIWALSPVLYGGVDVVNGKVVQSNFDSLQKARIQDTPDIEIKIIDSQRDPVGVGEPAVPPLAPAVFNAYFAATGKRVKEMPLIKNNQG